MYGSSDVAVTPCHCNNTRQTPVFVFPQSCLLVDWCYTCWSMLLEKAGRTNNINKLFFHMLWTQENRTENSNAKEKNQQNKPKISPPHLLSQLQNSWEVLIDFHNSSAESFCRKCPTNCSFPRFQLHMPYWMASPHTELKNWELSMVMRKQ